MVVAGGGRLVVHSIQTVAPVAACYIAAVASAAEMKTHVQILGKSVKVSKITACKLDLTC